MFMLGLEEQLVVGCSLTLRFGLYFHFYLELHVVLETWGKASLSHSLWVHDLDHTHSLARFQWSIGLSDQQTLIVTENCLHYQKCCPYHGRGVVFMPICGDKVRNDRPTNQIKTFLYPAKIAVMCHARAYEWWNGFTAHKLLVHGMSYVSFVVILWWPASHMSLCTYHIVSHKKASPVPNRWLIDVCSSNQFIDYEYPVVIGGRCHSYSHNKHTDLIPCFVLDPQYHGNQLLRKRYMRLPHSQPSWAVFISTLCTYQPLRAA